MSLPVCGLIAFNLDANSLSNDVGKLLIQALNVVAFATRVIHSTDASIATFCELLHAQKTLLEKVFSATVELLTTSLNSLDF